MIFSEIGLEELKKYQKQKVHRYFFSQSYLYATLAKNNNINYKILAIKENDELLAYSIFLIFKHKKIFYKAITHYGPIFIDKNNKNLPKFYFENLKKYFSKNILFTSIIVNPFINETFFNDINIIENNPISHDIDIDLKNIGFTPMNEDAFSNPALAGRCVYSKEISNITKENLSKNISTRARRSFEKAKKEYVKVRELDIFNKKDAEIFDKINRNTEQRINFKIRENNYFRNFKTVFNDNIKFLCSYIDTDEYIEKYRKNIKDLESEIENLHNQKSKKNVNIEKISKKIDECTNLLNKLYIKINDMLLLQKNNGSELYLACTSFIISSNDVIYYTGAYLPEFSKYYGVYAIHEYMLNYAIDNNFNFYNFFGTSNDFTEKAVDYSVLQFKRNFKGNIERFMDNYQLKIGLGKLIKML